MTVTDWGRELRHSWPLLMSDGDSAIAASPMALSFQSGAVRVGVDGTGTRHLLVPIGDEALQLEASEGALAVRVRTYSFSEPPRHFLDVTCTRIDLFDLFDDVLADVLTSLDEKEAAPATRTVEVIDRWRNLLQTRRRQLLSTTAIMSIFGELTVLGIVSGPGASPIDVECWRGRCASHRIFCSPATPSRLRRSVRRPRWLRSTASRNSMRREFRSRW